MTDEVAARVAELAQQLGQPQQNLVALAVAVDVVEGLEVVQVDVAQACVYLALQKALQTLLDRDVARQQGQGVGVTRLLQLQLGDLAQHVDAPPKPLVDALVNDDEVIFQSLSGATGQQATDPLQALADIYDQAVRVHQLTNRLAAVDLLAEGLEHGLAQGVPLNCANRALLLIDHRQGVQSGLLLEALQYGLYLGMFGHAADRQQQAVNRGVVVAAGLPLIQYRAQFAVVQLGVAVGAPEQVALYPIDADVGQHSELFLLLNAFGDDLGARRFGHLQNGADEFPFYRVAVNAVDKVPVDLHVLGLQL